MSPPFFEDRRTCSHRGLVRAPLSPDGLPFWCQHRPKTGFCGLFWQCLCAHTSTKCGLSPWDGGAAAAAGTHRVRQTSLPATWSSVSHKWRNTWRVPCSRALKMYDERSRRLLKAYPDQPQPGLSEANSFTGLCKAANRRFFGEKEKKKGSTVLSGESNQWLYLYPCIIDVRCQNVWLHLHSYATYVRCQNWTCSLIPLMSEVRTRDCTHILMSSMLRDCTSPLTCPGLLKLRRGNEVTKWALPGFKLCSFLTNAIDVILIAVQINSFGGSTS